LTRTEFFEQAGIPKERNEKYLKIFLANHIDDTVIDQLDQALLERLGIEAAGDRLKILNQIKVVYNRITKCGSICLKNHRTQDH
jgi:hypothetical protein